MVAWVAGSNLGSPADQKLLTSSLHSIIWHCGPHWPSSTISNTLRWIQDHGAKVLYYTVPGAPAFKTVCLKTANLLFSFPLQLCTYPGQTVGLLNSIIWHCLHYPPIATLSRVLNYILGLYSSVYQLGHLWSSSEIHLQHLCGCSTDMIFVRSFTEAFF